MDQPLGVVLDARHGKPIPLSPEAPRSSVIPLALRTKVELYQAWMPFIRGGGFFVPTARPYDLGEEVFLLLSLMQDPAKIQLRGTVAWINPANLAGGAPQGIGVGLQGEPASEGLQKLIAGILAGALNSSRPTHTL
jgi:type IV pilus assembly protein PilZ